VAESLFKAGKIKDIHVIELENNGYVMDPEARRLIEIELQKR